MRFLKGWAGCLIGLSIVSLAVSMFNGSLGSINAAWFVTTAIFAAVGATIIAFLERSDWSMRGYALAGVASAGTVMFIGFCVIVNALAQQGFAVGWDEILVNLAVCVASGILAGIGYRTISGGKS